MKRQSAMLAKGSHAALTDLNKTCSFGGMHGLTSEADGPGAADPEIDPNQKPIHEVGDVRLLSLSRRCQ